MNPPPLLVSFSTADFFLRAAPHVSSNTATTALFRDLVARQLPPCIDAVSIGVLFGFSTRFVMSMANRPAKHYRHFSIRSGKKKREIDAPRVGLKSIQSWLGHHLSRAVGLPDCVHGFVPSRSTVTAAKVHLGAEWIVSIDIRDFFPSVGRDAVARVLSELKYGVRGCEVISRLTTLKKCLPQGSPASPVLANLAFASVDKKLQELAESNDARFTRYADDLVFSGKGTLPKSIEREMCEIVQSEGWQVAQEKTSVQQNPHSKNVHGILVHGDSLRLPKKYRNRIRMMLYADTLFDLPEDLRRIYKGHISYASSIYQRKLEDSGTL